MKSTQIKTEITPSNWYLVAHSEAARKSKNIIRLMYGDNTIGGAPNNDIQLTTRLCSKNHCLISVTYDAVILRDLSKFGTRVNRIIYKDSRSIITENDLIGFGCNVNTRHINDKNDVKHFVYRLSNGNPLQNQSIDLTLDDDDDGQTKTMPVNSPTDSGFCGNDTDGEDSDNDVDIKPDIHSLIRQQREVVEQRNVGIAIKEEIDWINYDSERFDQKSIDPYVVDEIDLCDDDDDEDDELVELSEPCKKRRKNESTWDECIVLEPCKVSPVIVEPIESKIELPPAHEWKVNVLKEKVKNTTQSKGQQLANDFFSTKSYMNDVVKVTASTSTASKKIAVAKPMNNDVINKIHENQYLNKIISDITSWDKKWILDHLDSLPLVRSSPIGLEFSDLEGYQMKMKNFIILEMHAIIIDEFNRKLKTAQMFTDLKTMELKNHGDAQLKRFVFDCSAKKKDYKLCKILAGDFAIVKFGDDHILAFVTDVKQSADYFFFKMETAQCERNQQLNRRLHKPPKYLQVNLVTNIRQHLEYLNALYSMGDSRLKDFILKPCDSIAYTTDNCIDKFDNIVDSIYKQYACSIMSDAEIILVNGGAGTGKSTFIIELLKRFKADEFQFTPDRPILVCGISNRLVDDLAIRLLKVFDNFVRFGNEELINKKLSKESKVVGFKNKNEIKLKTAKIVLTTMHDAADLLQFGCNFDVCLVDDASLIPEAHLFPVLQYDLQTLILIGDKKLETPSILSKPCRDNGFARSLFGRFIENCDIKGKAEKKTFYPSLKTVYRMSKPILEWPNKIFYDMQLTVKSTPHIKKSTFPAYTVFQMNVIDNIELNFLKDLLKVCTKAVPATKVPYGIICGSPKTHELLNPMIMSNPDYKYGIEISGFDCFQGIEKRIIIITALHPHDGFQLLNTLQNLTMALTRAVDSVIFCGNFQHVVTGFHVETINATMSSTWDKFLHDAKQRKRFFDLDGKFNEQIIKKALDID